MFSLHIINMPKQSQRVSNRQRVLKRRSKKTSRQRAKLRSINKRKSPRRRRRTTRRKKGGNPPPRPSLLNTFKEKVRNVLKTPLNNKSPQCDMEKFLQDCIQDPWKRDKINAILRSQQDIPKPQPQLQQPMFSIANSTK